LFERRKTLRKYDIGNVCAAAKAVMNPEDMDHCRSDLYLRKNAESDAIMADFDGSAGMFRDNIDRVFWYEIPLGYSEYFNHA
jgi:post-segregation antitoxin (ccd killing protein)